jgi:hypothetical protein
MPGTRKCLECDNPVFGRLDKKFCSDACRNAYNNKIRSEDLSIIRNTNNLLKKNRLILAEICTGDKYKTTKSVLQKKGYLFQYMTHQRTTQNGSVYHFVYDYGLLELEQGYVLIVKDNRN